ncbi:DUF6712 family protein [Hymenobacter nivis]|uniref:Uncharacterized protein n=1 Tax=Hymenobacter nivis TaxID=1850093 RepID=A0A502HE84_9BACT|nr:DUF6712 family protein [Hymenobacter nivis]TPG71985.1 hypothetical protein EAH73_01705 [Hymenobacter nivis]
MALLKTIDELRRYVAIDASDIPPAIALAIIEAEADCLSPLLGSALQDWLQVAYDAPTFDPDAPTPAAQLLRRVQGALGRLGTGVGLTGHQVSIDATGVHIIVGDTMKTAFQWQVVQRQQQLLRQGQRGLDEVVQWLEDHREDSAELRDWAISPAGRRHRRELFTCTADFQEYENISNSRLVFGALGPVRRRLEAFELGPVLGPDFLAELRDQVRARSLTSDNENLLRTYVYPALASLTIGHAVPELGLALNGDGIDLTIARVDDSNSKEADAGLDQLLSTKANEALMAGARYLRNLTSYLDRTASATRFATYFNSSAYTNPNTPVLERNRPDSPTYKFCG